MPTPPRTTEGQKSSAASSGARRLAKLTQALPTMQATQVTITQGCL